MRAFLEIVFSGQTLNCKQAEEAMDLILESSQSNESVAAFLGALQVRSETADELLGFVNSILKKSVAIELGTDTAIDVCGTGGDQSATFNVSTAVAIILAAAGVSVAKHGNRSVSSQCGSADVLEAIGIRIDLSCEQTVKQLKETGFGFFFAPNYHPVLAKVKELRKAIGAKTVFNLLGPLCNPARTRRQLVGVYDKTRLQKIAQVLKNSGTVEAMVVSSEDGLDEISLSHVTHVAHLKNDRIIEFQMTPKDFGFELQPRELLRGGTAKKNAQILTEIFEGQKSARRNIVVMNASAALVIAQKVQGFMDGRELAEQAIDSGKVKSLVRRLINDGQRA